MSGSWPGVSARGVLDGDAEALAGLCDRRGPSVVGYCECVCGPERAIEAASAAFAAFRAGAVRANDPLSIDPEALLLGRTRASAAQRAPKPAGSLVYAEVPCSQIAALLAENATGSLSAADRDRLRRHLARCVTCRATQGVQKQAERAYFHPPTETLDPISRQEIIEALRKAVAVTAATNGHRPAPAARPAPPVPIAPPPPPAPPAPVIQASVASVKPRVPQPLPRTVPVAGSALTSTPVGQGSPTGSAATPTPVTAQPAAPAPQPVAPEGEGGGHGPQGTVTPVSAHAQDQQARTGPRTPPAVGGQAGSADLAEQDTPPNGMPAAWDSPTGVMSAVELNAALGHGPPGAGDQHGGLVWPGDGASAAAGGTLSAPAEQPGRRRRAARPVGMAGASRLGAARVLGPVAVLVVGLLIALFVAGVFSGGSRHGNASPLSGAQTDPSTAVPSTSGVVAGGSSTGGGGSVPTGARRTAATTAASKRAAEKREQELARQLRAGGGTQTAGTGAKPTAPTATGTGTAGTGNTPTATKPPTTQTTPSTPAKTKPAGGSTVHELSTGSGSAPPATGVPATGVTGYQPG